MLLVNPSLTVVLLGDWNKLYIQPNWIAENVYCNKGMDIGVARQGTDLSITYRCDNIIIGPSQDQMTFSALDTDETTIDHLVSCVTNFLQKAITPDFTAFGFNCVFTETNSPQFADVLDSISDNSKIIGNGYEILSTKISRTLKKNGIILNVEFSQSGEKTKLHFNEHHGGPFTDMPTIDHEMINGFLLAAKNLIFALGYDMEEEE